MRFVQTLKNIWTIEELRKRLLITFLWYSYTEWDVLSCFPASIPMTSTRLQSFTAGSGLMQLLDMFSGGAFSQASIFALGIMPYITASIVIQLLGMVLLVPENAARG